MKIPAEILAELNLSHFISLDIETTGLDYQKDEIIEFGAIHYVNGEPAENLEILINPGKKIPHHISKITGIEDKDVKNAKTITEILDQILQFVNDLPILAHNVNFDLPFLEYNTRKIKGTSAGNEKIKDYTYFINEKYDTLPLAKTLLPFQQGFSLSSLAEYFKIEKVIRHRALPDAKTAAEIFLRLIEIALYSDFKDIRSILKILDPTDDSLKFFFYNLQKMLASNKFHIPKTIDIQSLYYSTNYYNIIGDDEDLPEGHLEVKPVDEEEIGKFFKIDGVLEKSFGPFEQRQSQVYMAQAVAQSFNGDNFLVVEAGTGTGKSLAYLLPAIRWSTENYGPFGRIIVSTNTKNLQEQLFFKDLPILHSILKERFKAVLLKGKANYLCLDKWYTILNDMKYRLNPYERIRMLPLYMWVKYTETGDISENNAFIVEKNLGLWSKFIAENNYCPGKSCKYYSKCYLWRARNNARNAHIVLVNHSLLFSDLASDQAVLSEYSHLIFDEAHNIEKVATEYLGIEISLWNFKDVLQKLYYKDRRETGILVQTRKRIQLSDLDESKKKMLFGHLDSLMPLILQAWTIIQGFFKELSIQLQAIKVVESNYEKTYRFRYTKDDRLSDKMQSYTTEFTDYLNNTISGINDLIELLKEIPDESFKFQKQVQQELVAQFTQMNTLKGNLEFLLVSEWDTWVYWFELSIDNEYDPCRLYAAPLKIAEILNDLLYKKLNSAVFTSATLTVGRDFDYFLGRVGLNFIQKERLTKLLLESPFDYNRQILFGIPSFIPDPRSVEYRPIVQNFLKQLAKEQPRGTLVLFTSYLLLNDLYNSLKLEYESEKIDLLAQGIDGSRNSLINQFRANPKSVLFGTDSFWEGVDVPGQSLEILLITKLPFDVPTDPIVQAKAEMIQNEGGNPFMDYTVPEAIIRFRQGFGRLIRSKTDYGAIIVLDNRIITKMYGRLFLESIPVRSRIFETPDDLWEELLAWFQSIERV